MLINSFNNNIYFSSIFKTHDRKREEFTDPNNEAEAKAFKASLGSNTSHHHIEQDIAPGKDDRYPHGRWLVTYWEKKTTSNNE